MWKIGIVLAGGANKGAYQVGCLKAISEAFGFESIKCVTGSSIGALNAYAFSSKKLNLVEQLWKNIDVEKNGRFMPHFASSYLPQNITCLVSDDPLIPKTTITLWNVKKSCVEYVLLNGKDRDMISNLLIASTKFPFFEKSYKIGENYYLDGAFVDNIPIYPLIDENLDYIFAIYFDGRRYCFENEIFDRKVIKLLDFKNSSRILDTFVYDPKKIDEMFEYGYRYTSEKINNIFKDNIQSNIDKRIACENGCGELRKSIEAVLWNLNSVTKKYMKKYKI